VHVITDVECRHGYLVPVVHTAFTGLSDQHIVVVKLLERSYKVHVGFYLPEGQTHTFMLFSSRLSQS